MRVAARTAPPPRKVAIVSKSSRILLAVASLGLLLVFVFPLWRIELEAPQYPEGLGLEIRVNTIQGVKPNDLRNINGLNHYIGMKRIEPDAIPELRLMPWIVLGLTGLGLAGAATGKRQLLWLWCAALAAFAVAGLVDFWKWEYDYGHNLDEEHAIIKVPGMNYQPPLIGSKRLLNFVATSWPGLGGLIAFAAGGLGFLALWREARAARRAAPASAAQRGGLQSVRPAEARR
jgi:hypothetical protein